MAQRPMWDWGLHIAAHALSVRSFTRVMPVIAADAVPNFVLHPTTLWKVGRLARDADLAAELEELKERGLPVVIVWGRDDTVIPWACAESLRRRARHDGGGHRPRQPQLAARRPGPVRRDHHQRHRHRDRRGDAGVLAAGPREPAGHEVCRRAHAGTDQGPGDDVTGVVHTGVDPRVGDHGGREPQHRVQLGHARARPPWRTRTPRRSGPDGHECDAGIRTPWVRTEPSSEGRPASGRA